MGWLEEERWPRCVIQPAGIVRILAGDQIPEIRPCLTPAPMGIGSGSNITARCRAWFDPVPLQFIVSDGAWLSKLATVLFPKARTLGFGRPHCQPG